MVNMIIFGLHRTLYGWTPEDLSPLMGNPGQTRVSKWGNSNSK